VLTAVAERVFLGQALLRADAPALEVELPSASGAPARAAPGTAPKAPTFSEFFWLGVHHILSGYDHLLFLLGVLLACRTRRSALILVTGFTLGHSLTLALATLNLVALPSRVVEPLIAATLAFVGLESLVRAERVSARLPITVAFGMIHGLGFAEALRQRGLGADGAPIAVPLLSFNLGVELGQLLVGAPLLFSLLWLARQPKLSGKARTLLALGVGGAGMYWLVERLFFSA
jgi:hydrogenase/urease accessory protein HupE